ncbi:hypothetical protein Tco_0311433, partial [Tanacetum coccineum]
MEPVGINQWNWLSPFGLSASEKKRKRSSEIIKEVFVKEDIVVDGMHRNLVPPPGVVGLKGLVRISQISQENGQNRANSNTGKDKVHKSQEYLSK